MNFDPQKFFIGLIDFFSILLPGALLTYVLKDANILQRYIGPIIEQKKLSEAEAWMIFFFSSYLLGHFIFLVGSIIMDDYLYDPIRQATSKGQIKNLAEGKPLSFALFRLLAAGLIKTNVDDAVDRAVKIKEHYLDPLNASSAINAFQWCKARLALEHSQATAAVERFEADSKFFRSFLIVLLILIPFELVAGRYVIAAVSVFLLGLAFWRYVDQRVKATSQAYWYAITLEAQRPDGYRELFPSPAPPPSHAGGVVYRHNGDRVEYLLVQAKNAAREWVLPKGHIGRGESTRETAVREVREETGVWGSVRDELTLLSFTVNAARVTVQFYLMEKLEEGRPSEIRKPVWLKLDDALTRATYLESKELLRLAEQRRSALSPGAAGVPD